MRKRIPTMVLVLAFAVGVLVLAGCGDKPAEQAEQAVPATQSTGTAAEHPTAQPAEHPGSPAADQAVATHDCAGGCGMTAVPEDQLTLVDGKWYCAGCVAKAKEHEGHDHG
ncbi:MAG: hypothetical protein IH621_17015 [Krumholzibacteria bacterium]|nr:hypothetical protein [Candidatus Krumholzibacteria bacterium]